MHRHPVLMQPTNGCDGCLEPQDVLRGACELGLERWWHISWQREGKRREGGGAPPIPRWGHCTCKAGSTGRRPITSLWLASEQKGRLVGDEARKIPGTTMARVSLQVKFPRAIAHGLHQSRYLLSLVHSWEGRGKLDQSHLNCRAQVSPLSH